MLHTELTICAIDPLMRIVGICGLENGMENASKG